MTASTLLPQIATRLLAALAATLVLCQNIDALPLSAYASRSVLSSGQWAKISVESTGMHFIPAATLRSWGISDPLKVRIHGYGGARISDRLSADTYIDDLPAIAVHAASEGVYFYGVGPVNWEKPGSTYQRTRNPFSSKVYYFITTSDEPASGPPLTGSPECSVAPATEYICPVLHELELAAMGEMGHNLYGEDFRFKPEQTFSFTLTDRVESTAITLRTAFAARSTGPSTISISAGDAALGSPRTIPPTAEYHAGSSVTASYSISPDLAGRTLSLKYRFSPSSTVQAARLDFIELNYTRRLTLGDGTLLFSVSQPEVSLDGASGNTHVWDVTDPGAVKEMNTSRRGSKAEWTNTASGLRSYAAWTEGSALPCPKFVATVTSQNLHDASAGNPDMVIITADIWRGEAEKLARLKSESADRLLARVVTAGEIYNEFSSGAPDANALRRYLKMVYDRGLAAGKPLRYALLLGRATWDNRGISLSDRDYSMTLPTWQTDEALAEERSYTSDDIFATLDDGSGADPRTDRLCIAVGRIPARSTAELRSYIDKIAAYESSAPEGLWRNRVMVVADNGDNGAHMDQTEAFCAEVSEKGRPVLFDKVYIDAFDIAGGVCEEGRRRMYRLLDEGVMWWHYSGHGTQDYFTAEKLLTSSDISTLYLKRLPMLCAVTCSFLRWDGSEPSGAERLAFSDNGGVIAAISATRRTFISDNAVFNNAIGREAFTPDSSGRLPAIGEILQRAKNHITDTDPNAEGRFRYVLLGDPSMRLALPQTRIAVESINGIDTETDSQPTVMGRQIAEIKCTVVDDNGDRINGFNGIVDAVLYDADRSTTTSGRRVSGTEGRRVTFDEHGDRLYAGRDTVADGSFTLRIPMPADIADNFRPATLNMAAYTPDGHRASNCYRNIYVSGTDDSAMPDTIPPTIEYAWLNHSGFADGQTVNPEPMLIARITDDTAINLSTSGIGNVMTVKLDGNRTLSDVTSYFTPEPTATGAAGTIAYPLPRLTVGSHTLELRVCDTSGNDDVAALRFFVSEDAGPRIFDIYTDTNPASTQARFYISHDRPDALLTIEMEIYDMRGRRVWTAKATERSGLLGSAPITWDLRDTGGHRVERGIYIYRAVVTDAVGHTSRSAAKRLAVTAR